MGHAPRHYLLNTVDSYLSLGMGVFSKLGLADPLPNHCGCWS